MRLIRVFWSAILAGVSISLGGTVFLSVENKPLGAFLFAVGLFMICVQGWHLYTGKIGTLPGQRPSYLGELIVIWLGNLAGACGLGGLLLLTRLDGLREKAAALCAVKLSDHALSVLLLSFCCGFLVQAAVWIYRSAKNPAAAIAGVFLPIMVFILCGFEHCVANMFYFTVGGAWSGHALVWMLLMTLGNSLGGLLVPFMAKLLKAEQ